MKVPQKRELDRIRDLLERRIYAPLKALWWSWGNVGGKAKIALVIWIGLAAFGWERIGTEADRDERAACTALADYKLGSTNTILFDASNPCARTGIVVEPNDLITIKVEPTVLHDASILAHPTGFLKRADESRLAVSLFASFKRVKKLPYFTLLGQVVSFDRPGEEAALLGKGKIFKIVPERHADHVGSTTVASTTFVFRVPDEGLPATSRRELVLFLNDVDIPWFPSGRYTFYGNNVGHAWVTVESALR